MRQPAGKPEDCAGRDRGNGPQSLCRAREKTMKTKLALALTLTLASANAYAISRYNSQDMSCNRAQSLVSDQGAVILHYSSSGDPGLPLYDRFVSDERFCGYDEYAKLSGVPTRDDASCPVLSCVERTYEHHDRHR